MSYYISRKTINISKKYGLSDVIKCYLLQSNNSNNVIEKLLQLNQAVNILDYFTHLEFIPTLNSLSLNQKNAIFSDLIYILHQLISLPAPTFQKFLQSDFNSVMPLNTSTNDLSHLYLYTHHLRLIIERLS